MTMQIGMFTSGYQRNPLEHCFQDAKPIQYNCLLLSGKLGTYLADMNEQAQDRLRLKMVILHQKHIFGLHIMPENGIITASTHFYCQTD